MATETIAMVHGSGGEATGALIETIFSREFDNDILDQMEDAALVDGAGRIAMTTDSFVVTPLEFPGGDIGRLCVCGTVNDLLMRGAIPKYLTCGFILEEGLEIEKLRRIVHSMAATAREAGVQIVAGDTKVVEGKGGLYINTAGVGFVPEGYAVSASGAEPSDAILVSGRMGDHHAAILSQRLSIENTIESDNAPLTEPVQALRRGGIHIHAMRDITRGGLATVLKELAMAGGAGFVIEEEKLPVSPQVRDFCGLLGLDPLYMGNEGKMALIVPGEEAQRAVELLRGTQYGKEAAVIGSVTAENPGSVSLVTPIGGIRNLSILQGEGLPRIC